MVVIFALLLFVVEMICGLLYDVNFVRVLNEEINE
jgi:hypothetical protein